MSTLPAPVVRTLIACEVVQADIENPRRLSLLRVLNNIHAVGDPPYPALVPVLSVFPILTNGRGTGDVQVEICHPDSDQTIVTERDQLSDTRPGVPAPGLYWAQLRYN
jgi:hypothetical protein